MKSKITQFRLVFAQKLKIEIRKENLISKREKITKFRKIKLIYASKSKSKPNVIGQKIRKQICSLTQNRAQNDSINCRIGAFHSEF